MQARGLWPSSRTMLGEKNQSLSLHFFFFFFVPSSFLASHPPFSFSAFLFLCFYSYVYAKAQFETSKRFAVIMSGQTWTEAVIRKLVLSYLPKSLNQRRQDKTCAYRPQLNFIQPVSDRGVIPVLPQVPSKRYSVDASAL